jgi:penicillin amidase
MSVKRIFLNFLVITGAFLYGIWMPHKRAKIEGVGIKGAAEIYYEDNGVPHIQATSQLMAGFALGYTHATDRLWQMHFNRMLPLGRLSEMFGEVSVRFDQTMRLLNAKDN